MQSNEIERLIMFNRNEEHSVFLYPEEHSVCEYFCRSEDSLEYIELPADRSIKRRFNHNALVVVFQGAIEIIPDTHREPVLVRNSFFAIVAGSESKFLTLSFSVLIVISLKDVWQICPSLSFEKLFEKLQYNTNKDLELVLLTINEPIRLTLESYYYSTKAGLKCNNYKNLKREEILYIIRGFYSKSELLGLLLPFVGAGTAFRTFIYRHFKTTWSVDQIAALANMTKDGFIKKFKKIFGQTPGNWLTSQRIKLINYDLTNTNKTLKEIAFDYGFSQVCSFSTFCKRNMKQTPSQIREKAKSQKRY